MDWNEDSVKVAILIADAPFHGLFGVSGDRLPKGCPKHNDPFEIVHKMAARSITLYFVGCGPSLLSFTPVFHALTLISGGKYVPLDQANNLSEVSF